MASRPSIAQVENAFRPAREIDSADRFAGRRGPVEEAYYALIAEGANVAIIGNRGIGKSSLARQVINLSRGDNTLLKKLDLPSDEKLDFLTVYLACGNQVGDIGSLLHRLLTSSECFGDWIYDIPQAKKRGRGLEPECRRWLFRIQGFTGRGKED